MKKRLIAIILGVVLVFAMSACGSPNASTTSGSANSGSASVDDNSDWVSLDLSFATFLTEENVCQGIIRTLQENLDEQMPGKVTITTYGSGTLLSAADIYDGVVGGTADIGYVQVDFLADRLPLSQIPNLPVFDFSSAACATSVWRDFVAQVQPEEYSDVQIIQCQAGGPQCFATNSKKIESIDDFKGLQFGCGSGRAKTVTAYGGKPVTIDSTEYYEAMRSSLVDGIYTMFGACAFSNLDDVTKYALITPLQNSVYVFAMNKDVFNSMPASQQAAFLKACDDTYPEYTVPYQEDNILVERVQTFASNLESIDFLEGDLLEECRAAAGSIKEDYIKTLESKGFENPEQYFDLIDELVAKYNQEYTYEWYQSIFAELKTKNA